MAEAPEPDPQTVDRIRRIFARGVERLAELEVPQSDVMYGTMLIALEVAQREIGPGMTVEWLRNTADVQERALLDQAPTRRLNRQ